MAETVQGLDALLKSMEALPHVLRKQLIVQALRKGAEPIRQLAAQLAPDDPSTPGSRIRDSMMIQVSDATSIGAIARIGPSQKGFVGQFAEFGTSRQQPTPFLGPAFDQQQETALRIMGEVLAEGIETFFLRNN